MKICTFGLGVFGLLASGCGGSGAAVGGTTFDPAPFVGSYAGTWNNATFGSTGASRLTISADTAAMTTAMTLDLDGNVFGGIDPPADNLTGNYTNSGMTFSSVSPLFGTLNFTIDAAGNFSGGSNDVPGANVDSFTYTGTISGNTVNLNYTIQLASGATATGTLTMTKP